MDPFAAPEALVAGAIAVVVATALFVLAFGFGVRRVSRAAERAISADMAFYKTGYLALTAERDGLTSEVERLRSEAADSKRLSDLLRAQALADTTTADGLRRELRRRRSSTGGRPHQTTFTEALERVFDDLVPDIVAAEETTCRHAVSTYLALMDNRFRRLALPFREVVMLFDRLPLPAVASYLAAARTFQARVRPYRLHNTLFSASLDVEAREELLTSQNLLADLDPQFRATAPVLIERYTAKQFGALVDAIERCLEFRANQDAIRVMVPSREAIPTLKREFAEAGIGDAVTYTVDRSVLAGVVIDSGYTYVDYSLKRLVAAAGRDERELETA